MKMAKNEIKSTKCEWQHENVRLGLLLLLLLLIVARLLLEYSNSLIVVGLDTVLHRLSISNCELSERMTNEDVSE